MLDCTALSPLGAVVTGLRADALDELEVHQLRVLLAQRGVVVLPGQYIDDGAFLRFLRSFGETVFTTGETPVPGFPGPQPGQQRGPHPAAPLDVSHRHQLRAKPPAYTTLRAVEVPGRGGHTLFTDQYAAYETLPPDLRHRLDGRSITHVVTGLDLDAAQETQAVHPIFQVHPLSGRTALYLSAPQRCAAITGMSARQAAATVSWLFRHSTHDANVYRHAWSQGDVVMWDNRCVLHRADHAGVVGDRVMHRGMVADRGGP